MHGEERGGDRRSAWTDPHFWMPLIIQAVISLIAIVTIINKTGADITVLKEKVDELRGQVTTLQSLATASVEAKGKVEALTERVGKLETFQSTQELAYNFSFTTRLARAEEHLGIPPPKKQGD